MMNYDAFKAALLTDLGNIDFQSKGMDVDIENPGSIDGYQDAMVVTLRKNEKQKIGAAVDLTTIYEDYEGGMLYAEVLKKIREAIDVLRDIPEVKYDVENWLVMKDKVEVVLRCREGNGRILKTSLHSFIEDMVMLYKFNLGDNGEDIGYVTERMLKAWGISKEELKEVAIANTERNHPAEIKGLKDFMVDTGMYKPECLEELEERQWRISVPGGELGAVVITYPGLLDRVAEQLDDDLFIIASSIHEIIVMRAHGEECKNTEELGKLIVEENAIMLGIPEKLSDNLFHYDRAAKKFETVEHWKERAGKTA